MAVTAKKLDIKIGDLVEIEGRRYDVVSDKQAAVALEPAITKTVAEIHAEAGTPPMTPQGFEQYFGDLPSDGEG
jgi:anaerobic selenocysteine-containing dehydrogenase